MLSIVLPASGPDDVVLERTLPRYQAALVALGQEYEIVLVGDLPPAVARLVAAERDLCACVAPVPGWGAAVRAGLAAARGDVLCYANYERTTPGALAEMLAYALRNPDVVTRANRRTRDSLLKRLGSLLFNIECRVVLGVGAWDVNGTPKVFSRDREKLLGLRRDDELLDAEFALVCERERYRVVEVPIESAALAGETRAPDLFRALRMYATVPSLRRLAQPPAR